MVSFLQKRLCCNNTVTMATPQIFFFTTIHFVPPTYHCIKKIWFCFVLPWGGVHFFFTLLAAALIGLSINYRFNRKSKRGNNIEQVSHCRSRVDFVNGGDIILHIFAKANYFWESLRNGTRVYQFGIFWCSRSN